MKSSLFSWILQKSTYQIERACGMKRKTFRKIWGGLLGTWALWSILLAGRESVNRQIPESLRLYEDEAVQVLADGQEKISPQKLHLDFSGDISIVERGNGFYSAACSLFGVIPLKTMKVQVVQRSTLLPGGIPVGIYVQTDGVFVVGTGAVEMADGQTIDSPAENILRTGDYLTSFQGERLTGKKDLVQLLEKFDGEEAVVGVRRNDEQFDVTLKPVYADGKCCLGIWVRDDTQGIGMLTYVTGDRKFGALGHGISDADSSLLMEVSDGRLYDCEIIRITRGRQGEPGRLSGKIHYVPQDYYGKIVGNGGVGIYGEANSNLLSKIETEPMEIALKQEVEEGKAMILTSVDGTLKQYEIELTKVYRGERDVHKGMELRVTDEELLSLTGGIVQGMSGSPIIQNGKIVGALTHVFVNDPTKGYGIFIEEMLTSPSGNIPDTESKSAP